MPDNSITRDGTLVLSHYLEEQDSFKSYLRHSHLKRSSGPTSPAIFAIEVLPKPGKLPMVCASSE
ncbi:hypothetical protein NTGBS_880006 [Candidatus Nitrotoga sp. BS]|nr:hypothetical protein NTGBS_880006 [Candidatus Nitrotoga sp. BS]